MTNAELITTLRWCGSEDERHEMCVDESYRCPIWNEDRITDECKAELMLDAADALEAAEQRIDELENDKTNLEAEIINLEIALDKAHCELVRRKDENVTDCHTLEEGER